MMTFALTYGTPVQDACLKTYGAGKQAMIDSFGGMIPCVVKKVIEPGRGQYPTEGKVQVEVTKSVGGYRKGEIVERSASYIVPCGYLRRGKYSSSINTLYRWA
jgi:hypothetical protein